MAISGSWKANALEKYSGASVWGTGINPVHALPDGGGRNIAPYETSGTMSDDMTQQYDANDTAYLPEDSASVLWGYGVDTGTSERPPWNESESRNAVPSNWPHWGRTANGAPGGTHLRSHDVGAEATYTGKQVPKENGTQGWRNKLRSYVESALTSDPSQYEMQTSMTQRDKVRAGSQVPAGRENEYDAPIPSRIPGMKLKVYSGGERHAEMEPKSQDLILRPFWPRTAGTAYREWLYPNSMYVSDPMQREVPDNPYAGPSVPLTDNYGYTEEDLGTTYGY